MQQGRIRRMQSPTYFSRNIENQYAEQFQIGFADRRERLARQDNKIRLFQGDGGCPVGLNAEHRSLAKTMSFFKDDQLIIGLTLTGN